MPTSRVGSGKARKPAKPRRSEVPPAPYHHGNLPATLLAAAEAVLARDGLPGLTMRSIAREAGVSHTAPRHHFGDTRGLLSDLAAVGYERLTASMEAAIEEASSPFEHRNALAQAYVRFANANPRLFGLMFRNDMIDTSRDQLSKSLGSTMRVMMSTIDGKSSDAIGKSTGSAIALADVLRATAAWAYVHGLAILLIDNRLSGLARRSDTFDDSLALVTAVLDSVRLDINILPNARRGVRRAPREAKR